MDRGQTQTPLERFGSGREIKTSRASSLLCEDRAVYQRTLFCYLNRLVFILFLLLLLSLFDCLVAFFFQETVGTRKTSARAARGIARENEARDYSARLLHALFAFTRPIIAKK